MVSNYFRFPSCSKYVSIHIVITTLRILFLVIVIIVIVFSIVYTIFIISIIINVIFNISHPLSLRQTDKYGSDLDTHDILQFAADIRAIWNILNANHVDDCDIMSSGYLRTLYKINESANWQYFS